MAPDGRFEPASNGLEPERAQQAPRGEEEILEARRVGRELQNRDPRLPQGDGQRGDGVLVGREPQLVAVGNHVLDPALVQAQGLRTLGLAAAFLALATCTPASAAAPPTTIKTGASTGILLSAYGSVWTTDSSTDAGS